MCRKMLGPAVDHAHQRLLETFDDRGCRFLRSRSLRGNLLEGGHSLIAFLQWLEQCGLLMVVPGSTLVRRLSSPLLRC